MVRYLRILRQKKRYEAHRRQLEETCSIGVGFGESPLYESAEQALLRFKVKMRPPMRKGVLIGENCNLTASIFLGSQGSVEIGDFVYMNEGVQMRVDYHLKIGNHCMFGPRVQIWDTSNHPLSVSERHAQCEFIAKEGFVDSYLSKGGDIVIEDDVWIGMDALIMPSVRVSRGSIVAARSVVTKDVPPMTVVAGVPARVIGAVPA